MPTLVTSYSTTSPTSTLTHSRTGHNRRARMFSTLHLPLLRPYLSSLSLSFISRSPLPRSLSRGRASHISEVPFFARNTNFLSPFPPSISMSSCQPTSSSSECFPECTLPPQNQGAWHGHDINRRFPDPLAAPQLPADYHPILSSSPSSGDAIYDIKSFIDFYCPPPTHGSIRKTYSQSIVDVICASSPRKISPLTFDYSPLHCPTPSSLSPPSHPPLLNAAPNETSAHG